MGLLPPSPVGANLTGVDLACHEHGQSDEKDHPRLGGQADEHRQSEGADEVGGIELLSCSHAVPFLNQPAQDWHGLR